MAMTVRDLVADDAMATRPFAGRSGLDREVAWAHACEMSDPWNWIGEGHLLMTTGLGVPAGASAQAAYVEGLDAAGVAGVAVGEDMFAPPLTPEMLAAADVRGLPLMWTRRDIPFITLGRAVAETNQRVARRRVEQTAAVYDAFRRVGVTSAGPHSLLADLEAVVGCSLTVVPPGAEPADAATVPLPGPRPAVLVARSFGAGRPDRAVLQHLAAVVALEQTWVVAERERARRQGASLLAQLFDDRLGRATATTQLDERGLAAAPVVLVACRGADTDDELQRLHHTLDDLALPHLVLTRPPVTYVLVQDAADAVAAVVAALPPAATAGTSDPFTAPGGLAAAQREARWAMRRATERRVRLFRHGDDVGESVFLPTDREHGHEAARRVLGPVLDYDDAHGGRLTASLRVFLEENRSWLAASRRLHVHKQTLVYRMRRVEELTGRRLDRTGDVAELWLAITAAEAAGLWEI